MLLDRDDEFTTDQSGTLKGQLVTATAIGTRQKYSANARDWASGEVVTPYVKVTDVAAFNPGTSCVVTIEGADDVGLTSNAVVLSTKTLTGTQAAGTIFHMPALTPGTRKKFLGCRFTVTGNATTGALICGLVDKDARTQDGANTI